MAFVKRMYKRWIEDWDLRLANVSTDRVVRPFEWGIDWAESWPIRLSPTNGAFEPKSHLTTISHLIVQNSDQFYSYETPADFQLRGAQLTFTSAERSPHPANDYVKARWFPAVDRKTGQPSKKAVILLPHWNSREHSYVGLARLIQRLGISCLRLSLPYHDRRMPAELHRADYAVSSNIGRTIGATRQAIVDIRSCVDWLQQTGHEKMGIVGTSLGSAYAFLASTHDERITVNAFNHVSAYFADVVWTGLATRHIRDSVEGHVTADELRNLWLGISPYPYIEKFGKMNKKSLFIYAQYDTSFLPEFSVETVAKIREHAPHAKVAVLPCGHYTTGEFPYKFIDGFYIGRFLSQAFRD